MAEPPARNANANDALARFAGRPVAVVALATWAAAEAIFLPIVPDIGLCLLALAAPRRAAALFAAVVAGALAGSILLAAFAIQAPEAARRLVLSVPGIDGRMLADAGASLERDGLGGFAQLGPGPPLKVYSVEWLARGGDILGLLAGGVLNRITRIGPALVVAAAIGSVAGPWLRRHAR